ncbi:MAG: rhodanese-like domain-containing protein [Gemmatimonadota bacterium]
MRRIAFACLAAAIFLSLAVGCGRGDAEARRATAEPDSVAAALEAEMAKFPERYAEEPVALVSVDEVRQLVEDGADVLLVDAREPESYARGHVPGALNFPYGNWLEEGAPLPPADRDLIVYCNNQDCPIGRLWAEQAVQRGYTRLRHMKAGFKGWEEAGLPVATGTS